MRSFSPPARPAAPFARLAARSRAHALVLALAAGAALGGCDPLILLGNECGSQLDCEGAALCVNEVCVAQCRLDSECGDAGPTAVCQFNRCTVPVVFVDLGTGDQSVDSGADFSTDLGADSGVDAGADFSIDAARDQSLADASTDLSALDLGVDLGADMSADLDANLSDLSFDAALDQSIDDAAFDLSLVDAAADLQGDVIVPLLDMGP